MRRASRTKSPPTTSVARRCSPTRPNAMPTSSAKALTMAGRRTRPGNIRCPSAPISALSFAPRASGSTDLPLGLLQDIDAQRTGEIAAAAARRASDPVDFGHQGVQRDLAHARDGAEFLPELVFQRDAGLVAVDGDRAFAHTGIVAAATRPLNWG